MALIPVYALYGSQDESLVAGDVRRLFEGIRAKGGDARFRVLREKGHYISDEAFMSDELNEWLDSL